MEKLFKRITEYSDVWASVQGDFEGKTISIRYREGLVEAQGHFDYPFQIGIATSLLNPTPENVMGTGTIVF